MPLYIHGTGNISPQQTWGGQFGFQQRMDARMSAVEPDYAPFVDQKVLRRMSRIIKMGVASAMMALQESSVAVPDVIITGTGYGCLEDTGVFLSKMISNKEEALNPTPFIQSTHNTIGSQIALLLQCQGYNQTYAHGAFSFENALQDAMLHALENPNQQLLIGGIDEITDFSFQILHRFEYFHGKPIGEASVFIVGSGVKRADSKACIHDLATIYKPDRTDLRTRMREVSSFMPAVDLIVTGTFVEDDLLRTLCAELFPGVLTLPFKSYCGEFPVAGAFGLWTAIQLITSKPIDGVNPGNDSVKNILVLNESLGTHYSLIAVSAC
jgi:3-oxoacyl-[acyl-carrier-protein] synthase II